MLNGRDDSILKFGQLLNVVCILQLRALDETVTLLHRSVFDGLRYRAAHVVHGVQYSVVDLANNSSKYGALVCDIDTIVRCCLPEPLLKHRKNHFYLQPLRISKVIENERFCRADSK